MYTGAIGYVRVKILSTLCIQFNMKIANVQTINI